MAKTTLPYLSFVAILVFVISRLMSIIGVKQVRPWTDLLPSDLLTLDISTKLSFDESSLELASTDFGNIVHELPAGVFYPTSVKDIATLVKFSYHNTFPIKIAARGRGHSCRGQAMAENGIVIDMTSLSKHHTNQNNNISKISGNINTYDDQGHSYYNNRIRVSYDATNGNFADVGGEQLWIDVLHATLEHGVAPVSWTDYLYLTVGGTLSNAGISGQAFRYGPQISNVYELDVVTGKGELITCSKSRNQELFYAVLGGLGQFGIISRARIKLELAPKRVKWVRMLYNDYSEFIADQEQLIAPYGAQGLRDSHYDGLNYVEGSLIMQHASPNNWRSSFFSPADQAKVASMRTSNGIVYCLEVVKYYYDHEDVRVDKDLEDQLKKLNFLSGFIFSRDVTFVEFLNRVRKGEVELQCQGLWDVPHPWLNIFIPRSRMEDFSHAISDIIAKYDEYLGPVLIYPLNRNKWDDRMSAVTPEEDVFYTVGLLHSKGFDDWETLEAQNQRILKFCDEYNIKIKQYLPHYSTSKEWKIHFGKKWGIFEQRKASFDPKMILSPGQKIFY